MTNNNDSNLRFSSKNKSLIQDIKIFFQTSKNFQKIIQASEENLPIKLIVENIIWILKNFTIKYLNLCKNTQNATDYLCNKFKIDYSKTKDLIDKENKNLYLDFKKFLLDTKEKFEKLSKISKNKNEKYNEINFENFENESSKNIERN